MSQVFSCFTPLHHPKWHFSLSHHPLILTQPRITINQPSSNKQQGGSFPDHHLHAPDSADLSRLGGLPRFRQTSQGAVLGAHLGGVRSLHGGGHGAVDAHGGGLVRRTSGAPWCFFSLEENGHKLLEWENIWEYFLWLGYISRNDDLVG